MHRSLTAAITALLFLAITCSQAIADIRLIELQHRHSETLLTALQPLFKDRLQLSRLEQILIASGPPDALDELQQLAQQLDTPLPRYQIEVSSGEADPVADPGHIRYSTGQSNTFSLAVTAHRPAYIDRSGFIALPQHQVEENTLRHGVYYHEFNAGFHVTLRPLPDDAVELAISTRSRQLDSKLDTVWGPGLRGHRLLTIQRIPLNKWVLLGARQHQIKSPATERSHSLYSTRPRHRLAVRVKALPPKH